MYFSRMVNIYVRIHKKTPLNNEKFQTGAGNDSFKYPAFPDIFPDISGKAGQSPSGTSKGGYYPSKSKKIILF